MTVGPGWYADPGTAGWWRWFDGAAWTSCTHPMQAVPFAYGYNTPPPQRDRGLEMLLPVNRTPMSIVAGYLGLFSLLLVPGPIAVAVAVLALRELNKKSDVAGRGRAWFGLICGAIASVTLAGIAISAIA
jgi:hypothetical protein